MKKNVEKVAIIIPSCDKYADLWNPFFASLRIMWPECPFVLYLISNHLVCQIPNVNTINVGEDKTWSANLITALEQIQHEYIFLFIDDLFLSKAINHYAIINMINHCVDNSWDYLRFNPTPGPETVDVKENNIGKIWPGDLYRASTVLSLWKKSVLLDILSADENAWDFELSGSQRTDKYINWFASSKWMMPYENIVIKGKIDPVAFRIIESTGIYIKTSRPVMSFIGQVIYNFKKIRSSLMFLVPRSKRKFLRGFFSAN
jgi:hypothetical protein